MESDLDQIIFGVEVKKQKQRQDMALLKETINIL